MGSRELAAEYLFAIFLFKSCITFREKNKVLRYSVLIFITSTISITV